jgi:prepilin-type N-terminal cleavage/methylation domain-containing protein
MRRIWQNKRVKYPAGFSIIELMVVVTTIGILALLSIPGIRVAAERTEATATANDIRVFTQAIEFYSSTESDYPASMKYNQMPDKIASYLPAQWKNGSYSWYYVNTESFIYIYVYNLDFTTEQTVLVDSIIDDGNLATGNVRRAYQGGGIFYLFQHQLD